MNLFLSDIRALRLRFPVAMIARKMEANRANVSSYVRGVKVASVKFVLRFYAEFEKELADVGIKRDSSVFLAQKPGTVASSKVKECLRQDISTPSERPIGYAEIRERLKECIERLDKLLTILEPGVIHRLDMRTLL